MKNNTLILKGCMCLFPAVLFYTGIFAQNSFEGIIEYDMEVQGNDITPEIASRMPKESIIYVKNTLSRVEIKTGVSDITVIADNAANSATTLMNILGNKLAVKVDSADINKAVEQLGEYEIKYLDEKRKIAGYNCEKALIIRQNAADTSTVWYTRELPAIYTSMTRGLPKIDGFPMEVTTVQNGINVKMTVREIKEQPVDAALFEIPSDYKIVEQDKLQSELMGQ